MQQIQLSQFKKNFNYIIEMISNTHKPIATAKKGKLFLKLSLFFLQKMIHG